MAGVRDPDGVLASTLWEMVAAASQTWDVRWDGVWLRACPPGRLLRRQGWKLRDRHRGGPTGHPGRTT